MRAPQPLRNLRQNMRPMSAAWLPFLGLALWRSRQVVQNGHDLQRAEGVVPDSASRDGLGLDDARNGLRAGIGGHECASGPNDSHGLLSAHHALNQFNAVHAAQLTNQNACFQT